MLKINTFFAISLILLLSNCSTVKAPRESVPKRNAIATNTFGAWITISTDSIQSSVKGELIAIHSDSLFIMRSEKIQIFSKKDISNARIILFNNERGAYAIWTFLGSIATITNGGFLIFTLPITLITGISTTVRESKRINFYDYPSLSWDELTKYARFPQGITNEIEISKIKPKQHKN